jgi:hypothetical protein
LYYLIEKKPSKKSVTHMKAHQKTPQKNQLPSKQKKFPPTSSQQKKKKKKKKKKKLLYKNTIKHSTCEPHPQRDPRPPHDKHICDCEPVGEAQPQHDHGRGQHNHKTGRLG